MEKAFFLALLLFLFAPNWAFLSSGHRALHSFKKTSSLYAVEEIESLQGFDKIIQEAGEKVVVVDYSTTWCGPCKMVYPKYVELSNQHPDVIFLKCIGDSRPELNDLMKREGIRAVPTFHIWKKGEKCDVINGARIEEVEAAIKALK